MALTPLDILLAGTPDCLNLAFIVRGDGFYFPAELCT
jgi:hypothetical protein